MQVKVPGSAKRSPEGVTKSISAPFLLKDRVYPDACDGLYVVDHALDAVHDRVGFKAEVVALHIAVGHRT